MAIERLKKQEIFRFLRSEQIHRLSEASKVARFEAGDMVYRQGDPADRFYVVLKGQVSLRLPEQAVGPSVLIDELTEGDLFGGCVSDALDTYSLDAQCMKESEILVVSVSVLRAIMDEDPRMGYIIQSGISKIYFKRYAETMKKLQAVVMNLPVGSA